MNWTLAGRIRNAKIKLTLLPLDYGRPAPDGGIAWPMYLEADRVRDQFGIYSTAFAVQLLSHSPDLRAPAVLQAIDGGIRFLTSQWDQFEALRQGAARPGKQRTKNAEVGHSDFSLSLKHTLSLEAFAPLVHLKGLHSTYNNLLAEVQPIANAILADLVTFAKSVTDHAGAVSIGWPWHRVDPDAPLNPIPTAYALHAIVQSLFQGHAYPLDPAAVDRQLSAALNDLRVLPIVQALVVNLLDSAGRLNTSTFNLEQLLDRIKGEQSDRLAASWQETYHYDILRTGVLSHYKPWIWICPRIELAQAELALTGGTFSPDVLRTLHALLTNIRRHGAFRASLAKPPTLQGCWRAFVFLEKAEASYGT